MWGNDMSDADLQYMLDIEADNALSDEELDEYERDMAARDKRAGRED